MLAALADANSPVAADDLVRHSGLRPGMLHLALRLLEVSGFATRSGSIATGEVRTVATPAGRGLAAVAAALATAPDRVARARDFLADPETTIAPASVTGNDRIDAALSGPGLTAAMARLYRAGAFAGPRDDPLPDPAPWRRELVVLSRVGWATQGGGALTADGRLAAAMAPQFLYPAGYLALFAAAGEMMVGSGPVTLPRAADGTEEHVDRGVDIAFSGLVFARTCRDALFATALPLFDTVAPETQPVAVVDTGSGDGTLLRELWCAIVERTRRGAALDRFPLLMVAVEYNEVARAVSARELAAAGVPHMAIIGDIGDPDGIAASLAANRIDPSVVLHVSKSVIHNRTVAAAPVEALADPAFEASRAVHLDQDGSPMAASAMAADLVAFFRRWRPWTRRHGMIAIEAHAADPLRIAAAGDGTPIPALEASHGLSLQHLVEIGMHRRAAALAGYKPLAAHDLQGALLGQPLMSCDHLLPA